MYTLTPETLIRIEDSTDPKRWFINESWRVLLVRMCYVNPNDVRAVEESIKNSGQATWNGFRLIHPDAITEVE